MTTIHQTSCTECEALKINDCPQCDMYKWRVVQNGLAAIIALETIAFLSIGTYFAILIASQESIHTVIAINRFGGAEHIAGIGGGAVFIGCALLFAYRDQVTEWVLMWAKAIQASRDEDVLSEYDYEEEDDE